MKKILLLASSSLVILAGCATPPPPAPTYTDKEPILVGTPINERIAGSAQSINEQMELLNKIQSGQRVGTFSMVTHNNELDARKGSRNTVPQAYATMNTKPVAVAQAAPEVLTQNASLLDKKVKKIDWKQNSANELGKNFAQALGYSFAVNKQQDMKISVTIENETLGSAIDKFRAALGNNAQVVIVDANKTFNIIYK